MTSFAASIWEVLLELAPWLLLGSLIAGLMHVVLPANFLARQLQGGVGLLKSVLIGVPLPLCSCAVIPVGLSLKQAGASNGATVAFLVSTPQTGVDSVLVSASFLGWPFALFKVVSATVTGLLGGVWTDFEPARRTLPIVSTPSPQAQPTLPAWRRLIAHSVELLRSIWLWLAFGVVTSAAITTWVPTGVAADFAGGNDLVAMLITLVIALPLYVCATASVPIAAALVGTGLPVGAALVFLMAGPATNLATIGAVSRTLGRRPLLIYLATVILGSLLGGWMFGYLIDANAQQSTHTHASHTWWSQASAVILLGFLGWFTVEKMFRNSRLSATPHEHQASEQSSCCK